jgi:hypothetical protein
VGRYGAHAGRVRPAFGERPRERPGGGHALRRHRPRLALLRRPQRAQRRSPHSAPACDLRRRRRRGYLDG